MTLLVLFMGFAVYATLLKKQGKPNALSQDSLQNSRDTSGVPVNYGSASGLGDNASEMDTSRKPKKDTVKVVPKKPVPTLPDSTEDLTPDTTVTPDQ
jgi:hypothetical protein